MENIDPFNTVKEEVESSIVNVKSLYDHWLRINSGSSSSSQNSKRELNQLELNITELIENIDMDIVDLEQTIQIVETNQQKFNLSQAEIQKRKQFVSYARNTIMNIQKIIQEPRKKQQSFTDPLTSSSYSNNVRMENEQTIQIVETNQQKFNLSQAEIQKRKQFVSYARNTIMNIQKIIQEPRKKQQSFTDPLTSSSYSNNVRMENEQRHQQLLLQEQNEAMDDVLGTVYNMKEIARTMNNELDDQQGLLQELEEDVDNTTSHLSSARRRLDKIVDSNDYSSCTLLCIIIALFIIFLIVLVI